MLVAADVYRPAAMEQLRVLGEQIDVEVYFEAENKNPVEIALNAIKESRSKNKNVIIIDTAGRLAIDEAMMTEVANIKNAVNPQEILFVVDSMTGQDAVNTAKAFNDRLDFTGVVLTKLDGDTRGGAAFPLNTRLTNLLSLSVVVRRWIRLMYFILKVWPSVYWAWVISPHWLKKHRHNLMRKQARKLEKKIRKNQFDFADFQAAARADQKDG